RVVEFGAGVPDRVPDPVRDARDVVPTAVQQQHVQVTARQQFLAPVPADRDQGHAGLGAEEFGQPSIHLRSRGSPGCLPDPLASVTVRPWTPNACNAALTSSSLNGLMTAVMSFIWCPFG